MSRLTCYLDVLIMFKKLFNHHNVYRVDRVVRFEIVFLPTQLNYTVRVKLFH